MIIGYKVPPAKVTGIVFGQWRFTEPEFLPASGGLASLLANEGLYAILTDDASCTPRPFRVLYFGEAQNMSSRATAAHENFPAWRREAGLNGRVYRAFYAMPGSTQMQRQVVESSLIAAYNPVCNQKLSVDLASLLNRK